MCCSSWGHIESDTTVNSLTPNHDPAGLCMHAQPLQLCPTLCDPMNCSTPGFPVHHQLPELIPTHVHRVGDVSLNFTVDCSPPGSSVYGDSPGKNTGEWVTISSSRRPLLLLPPIPPSIRVFSNESTLCMRWSKYWSFSFTPYQFWSSDELGTVQSHEGKAV